MANKIDVISDSMGRHEEIWMKDVTVIVNCVPVALHAALNRYSPLHLS